MWQRVTDIVADVLVDLDARRGRTLLLVLAVCLSTGALVTSLGVGATASQQIGADLAADMLAEVTVFAGPNAAGHEGELFPEDAEERARAVALTMDAGLRVDLELSQAQPQRFSSSATAKDVRVFGSTAAYLEIAGAGGYEHVAWMFARPSRYQVVLLGSSAARALGIPQDLEAGQYQVYLAGDPYDVVGVLSGGAPALTDSIALPYQLALDQLGGDATARLVIRTEPGAGAAVASVAASAIRPDEPTILTTSRVADLRDLRRGVQDQLGRLVGAIGLLLLLLTGLLIANAMIVSVVSRTAEIGLRRALGASRALIVLLFLSEGAFVGALGGLGGAALGLCVVVTVSAVNGWTAVMSAALPALGVVLGLVIGVLASAYPAYRAAHISPAVAVRVE